MSTESTEEQALIQKEVLDLYEKAWKLEKETMNLGIKRQKSEIFLSREILQILIEIQDDYNNDGSSISPKLKQKKLNLLEKYIKKLKTSQHIEILTDLRNRSVLLLLISIPSKQTIHCLKHLISLKCNIHCIDNNGQNGYHIACEYSNYSAIKLLYKHNVDITLKDNSSEQLTPLHIALDILISSENNINCINNYKYYKVAKQCVEYALLSGQDIINDKLGKGSGGSWNFNAGESIFDVAIKNINVLTVLTEGFNQCSNLKKVFKKNILKYNNELNEVLVDLIWSFMYYKLPKLRLNAQLKKAKQRIQKERMQRRESMRNSIKGKKNKKTSKKITKTK